MGAVPRRENQRAAGSRSAEPCPAVGKRIGDATTRHTARKSEPHREAEN
jgi:hypothetical protein